MPPAPFRAGGTATYAATFSLVENWKYKGRFSPGTERSADAISGVGDPGYDVTISVPDSIIARARPVFPGNDLGKGLSPQQFFAEIFSRPSFR